MQQKILNLEKEVEASKTVTKSWASLFTVKLGDASKPIFSPVVVDSLCNKNVKRKSREVNIRVRGIPSKGQPLEEAKELLSKLHSTDEGLIKAWRVRDDSTLILKFKSLQDKSKVMRKKAALKGTQIFVDDDLTMTQYLARRQIIQDARARGKRVVFSTEGHRFFDIRA